MTYEYQYSHWRRLRLVIHDRKSQTKLFGITAVESILGWVLSGPYETNVRPTSTNFVNSHVLKLATELSLDTKFDLKSKQFWEYEAFNTDTNTKSSDFNLKKIENQIIFNRDKCEVYTFTLKCFTNFYQTISEIPSKD